MKLRLPLSAKITGLCVLNLAVLVVLALLLIQRFWGMRMMPTLRSEQLDTVAGELLPALQADSSEHWEAALETASQRYGVTLWLFGAEGERLAGPDEFMPGNVHQFVTAGRGQPRRGPPRPPEFEGRPPDEEPPPQEHASAPPDVSADRTVLSSSHAFWALARGHLDHANWQGRVSLVARSDSPTARGFYINERPLYWTLAAMVLASAVIWLPFVHSLTRLLRRMRHTAERLAQGDFSARAEEQRTDELGALGQSLNHMADQIGSLVEGQKRLLGDIAHELSSPIARMQATVGILDEQGVHEHQHRYMQRLETELQHMGKLVQELLSLSKASLRRSVELRPVTLRAQVERAIERECTNGETIEVNVPAHLVALSDPELLSRAIGNVLRNAIRYAGKCGPIQVNATTPQAGQILISITDQGPGVPASALPHLFDAFYRPDIARTRETGGTGLGLAIVKTCIEATHGQVSAHPRASGGLEIRLTQEAV